jgi:hypothetical protein
MMTMPNVIRCRCPVRKPILTACHHLQWTRQRKTGLVSSGGISSQIKVDFPFTTQIAKQGSDECVVNYMLIHASLEKHWADQTLRYAMESV